jgi:multiple sugar transport system substrate-binding protein
MKLNIVSKKKLTAVISAISLVASVLVSVSSAQAVVRPTWAAAAKKYSKVKLTGLVADTSWGNAAIAQSKKFTSLTGIKITFDKIPQDNYNQKLQAESFGKTGAYDFFAIADVITDFAKAGALEDLNKYVNDPKLPEYNLKDYSKNTLDFLSNRNGKLVTLPNELAGMVMYYRKDLFNAAGLKPPTTWEQTYTVGKALTKDGISGALIELKGGYAAYRSTNLLPAGTQWLDKKMRLSVLSNPKTLENFTILRNMYKDGVLPLSAIETDYGTLIQAFRAGTVAMLPAFWPSEIADTLDPSKSKVSSVVGFAPVPGAAPLGAGWGWAVSADSDAKTAAYLFISWLTNQEQSKEALVKYGLDRGRASVLTDETKAKILASVNGDAKLESISALNKSWANLKPSPTISEWSQVWDVIALHVAKIVVGTESPKDGLAAIQKEGEAILEKAGYYK